MAKKIISRYELQNKAQTKSYENIKIDKSDLWVLSSIIAIPKLTQSIVDESFAYCLNDSLNQLGHNVEWVSLDDMGYIIIKYGVGQITDKYISDLLPILNELLD